MVAGVRQMSFLSALPALRFVRVISPSYKFCAASIVDRYRTFNRTSTNLEKKSAHINIPNLVIALTFGKCTSVSLRALAQLAASSGFRKRTNATPLLRLVFLSLTTVTLKRTNNKYADQDIKKKKLYTKLVVFVICSLYYLAMRLQQLMYVIVGERKW